MIAKFDAGALYSRAALHKMLQPLGIDPDAFIARIKPTKRFRMAWLGADLLEAMKNAPPLSGEDAPEGTPPDAPRTGRRSARVDPGLAKLQAMIKGEE